MTVSKYIPLSVRVTVWGAALCTSAASPFQACIPPVLSRPRHRRLLGSAVVSPWISPSDIRLEYDSSSSDSRESRLLFVCALVGCEPWSPRVKGWGMCVLFTCAFQIMFSFNLLSRHTILSPWRTMGSLTMRLITTKPRRSDRCQQTRGVKARFVSQEEFGQASPSSRV